MDLMIFGAPKDHTKWLLFLLVILTPMPSYAKYDGYFSYYENKYKLPKNILKAISIVESKTLPWTMNIDGVPVYANSKNQAVTVLKHVARSHRFGIAYKQGERVKSGFYKTEKAAKKALKAKTRLGAKILKINKRFINKVNPKNSDICLMQVNYRWHGKDNFRSVNEMFDPEKCINYAAKYLSTLINRHGLDKGIGCYNGCGKSKSDQITMKSYIRKVKREWSSI